MRKIGVSGLPRLNDHRPDAPHGSRHEEKDLRGGCLLFGLYLVNQESGPEANK